MTRSAPGPAAPGGHGPRRRESGPRRQSDSHDGPAAGTARRELRNGPGPASRAAGTWQLAAMQCQLTGFKNRPGPGRPARDGSEAARQAGLRQPGLGWAATCHRTSESWNGKFNGWKFEGWFCPAGLETYEVAKPHSVTSGIIR